LALDANGVGSLFGKGDVIEDEDLLGAGERLNEVGTVSPEDGLLVPGTLIDELLQRLFGVGAGQVVRQRDLMGQGFDGLAFAIEPESVEVDAGPEGRLGLGVVSGEPGDIVAEAIQDGRIESGGVCFHSQLEGGILSGDSAI
jgi:hypothetical protein